MEKQQGITRRSFLNTSALVAGSLAAASVIGCQSATPTPADNADDAETTGTEPAGTETAGTEAVAEEPCFFGTCRTNCGGTCALQARVRDGKVVSTFAYEDEGRPEGIENGCVKGQTNILRLYGTHRITHPMKRVGEKGSGEWEQITWDEAIQMVADKMTAAIDEYGPASVGLQHGAGNKGGVLDGFTFMIANNKGWTPTLPGLGYGRFLQKTGATLFGFAADQAAMYLTRIVMPYAPSVVEDFVNCKTIVFWGMNPADATFTRSTWYWTCKAREAGAKIICIDPLFTATAAAADMWLPIRVGTDNMLMCAVGNYLLDNDLADLEAVKNTTNACFLIDEDGAFIRLSTLGREPLKTEEGEDDDAPVVWDETANDFVVFNETTTSALSGSFDANGVACRTVFDVMRETIAPFTMEAAAKECGLPLEQITEFAEAIAKDAPTSFQMGYGVEHTSESWHFAFSSKLLSALVGGVGKPGTGYFMAAASSNTYKKPVLNTDCVMVEGAEHNNRCITGDYVAEIVETGQWKGEDFPIRVLYISGSDPLDNFSGANRLIEAYKQIDFVVTVDSYMTTTAHYSDLVLPCCMVWEAEDYYALASLMSQKAVEPIGEARPDFDIIRDIAVAMGYDDLYPLDREGYLRAAMDTEENIANGVAYDDFATNGLIVGEYTSEAKVTAETNPLGRTLLYVEELIPRDNWGQEVKVTDRMPNYAKNMEADPDHPMRDQYPLFGFSTHAVYFGQSSWAHNAWMDNFRGLDGKPYCIISKTAADERGIQTGDKVRATSQHGTCVINAVVTEGIQEESVWFPHGFFWDEFEEGSPAQLTGLNIDPMTSNANFNDFILQVEKC